MSELKRRKDDKFPRRFLGIFQRLFFVIGIAATISIGMLTFTLLKLAQYTPPAMPGKILLTYTFKPGLSEIEGRPSLSQPLLRPATTFREIVFALENAAKDSRVLGFVGKMQDIDFSVAQVQELRDALAGFRKAGKFAWIYSESYGGFSPGMADYYLASAFDQIWMQPVGVVAIHGVAAEVPFARETLDKLGIEAQFAHKGKYKSAAESMTHTGMTAENREATESLVHDLYEQMTTGIAADRKMTMAELTGLIDTSPHADEEAFKAKLVDRLDYYDVMLADARKKAGLDKEDTVELLGYSFISETTDLKRGVTGFVSKFMWKEPPAATHKNKSKIALIYGAGEIVPYKKSQGTFGEGGMKAEKIVEAFDDALEDEDVAAIVFRIDTPGGSPSASETIRRAIKKAQAKNKPVVVSMGSYAASGGYWIASGANKIVAQPATITGSIGVFGGKLVIAGLLEKIGIRWEGVSEGQNARMWSANKPFTEAEFARFDAMLGATYDAFISRVAEGRKMTKEQAEEIAQGRVWTGKQAKERGLVDELGGLRQALILAKTEAKLDNVKDVPVVLFPPRKSTLEAFISLAAEGALFMPTIDARALLQQLQLPDEMVVVR